MTHTQRHSHTHPHTQRPLVTFGDAEFVVLLVPQAASVAVGDPNRKLGVWAV